MGEYKALEIISRYEIAALVLVMLTPMCNTPMAKAVPPGIEEMRGIFAAARDIDRKSTRLNSSHIPLSRMPSSA